ncbi:hypothetical protein CLHOM_14870 [Clostridium homopropionicum DSM 5847]|uniref:Uncharacterized protein n=1 Tax=Clostridium homopropionicum DSM 5847 TaxID=1121318 RepID=A0A0L6ZAY0_9CLOT|nr:hypothetical protein CLHOM_14870 [Clostridium homopropionicum DSM 5847]SFG99156.1 hypothetical protein SAMN04488501_13120 [Clostridium homopropionicum]
MFITNMDSFLLNVMTRLYKEDYITNEIRIVINKLLTWYNEVNFIWRRKNE